MAKYDPIPDEDHLIRHVPYSKLRKDGDGEVIGIEFTAFELRPGEDYLSATWAEYHPGTETQQLKTILTDIRKTRTAGPKSALAIGQVAEIKKSCLPTKVRALHFPEDDNPAHAGITLFPGEAAEILEALAAQSWSAYQMVSKLDGIP